MNLAVGQEKIRVIGLVLVHLGIELTNFLKYRKRQK